MIWEIEWGPVVYRDVLRIPWRTAGDLCAAIIRFAETGRGPAEHPYPHDPRRVRFVVPGAVAFAHADERTGVLYVSRLYRRG